MAWGWKVVARFNRFREVTESGRGPQKTNVVISNARHAAFRGEQVRFVPRGGA